MSERKDREICWDPDRMIYHAKALQEAAKHLELAQDDDLDPPEDLFMGKHLAHPILLALATEIALKAWQCRERKGDAPDRCHDLVELFEALSEGTRERLQARLPEHPWPCGAEHARLSGDPFGGGMRVVLEFHRDTFETWRYSYEATSAFTWPPQLDEGLTAIIETYNPPTPRHLFVLGNRA